MLVHLRGKTPKPATETAVMRLVAAAFGSRRRYELAQRLARAGRGPLAKLPIPGWSVARENPEIPAQSFREWWDERAR